MVAHQSGQGQADVNLVRQQPEYRQVGQVAFFLIAGTGQLQLAGEVDAELLPLQAIDALMEARRVFAALPDAYNEARTKTSLAQTYLLAGRPADAPGRPSPP